MLKPRALVRGSRVALIAPASPFDRDDFELGVEELRRLGFEPVYEDSVFARQSYLAGSPIVRAGAFKRAWADPGIDALIAVRGGYGSAQILPHLSVDEIRRTPKALIGYSDITMLLTYLTLHCHVVAFHGPMIDRRLSRGAEGYDLDSFARALCRTEPVGELTADGIETVREGDASGILLGGTMTQLLASFGTAFAFEPPPGHVLLLEEVAERPYRLDRMVTQFRQSGLLAKASAIVIGQLPGCDEPGGDPAGRAVMRSLFADFPGPVIVGFPTGHTTGPTMTLPLGVRCRIDARPSSATIVVEEAAVI